MSFGELCLIMVCTLAGPLLAGLRRMAPPLVVGELVAGIVIGQTGFRLIDTTQPTLKLLSDVGFALLMFSMGAGLPLRDSGMRQAMSVGAKASVVCCVVAVPIGYGVGNITNLTSPGAAAVLAATTSAALAAPALLERHLQDTPAGLATLAWASIVNVLTVMAIPLVLVSGSLVGASLGSVAVLVAAAIIFVLWRDARRHIWFKRFRKMSKRRGWGLDLRISLVALFFLCWLAVTFQTTTLVAGFSAGVVLALIGRPRRLAWQVLGLAEGFFVPLFFVVLGAQLDLRALWERPSTLWVTVLVLAASLLVHVIAAVSVRLPVATGLVTTAQMGVPAAVVSLGLSTKLLTPAEGAALMGAAVASVVVLAIGTRIMVAQRGAAMRQQQETAEQVTPA